MRWVSICASGRFLALALAISSGSTVLAPAQAQRATPPAAQAPAATKETLDAADRLMKAQDVDAMMLDMATNMAAQFPAEFRFKDAFVKEMTDPKLIGRMKGQMRLAMAKHLTVEELNAMAEFYSRPVAKSALKKTGAYMAEFMPFMQAEMMTLVGKLQEQQRNK